jgi:Glycosyltransferase family 87
MPSRLTAFLVTAAVVLALPATASAGNLASKVLIVRQGSPLAEVQSLSTVPLGWGSSARQAVTAAERSPTLQALHRRLHPLEVVPYVWRSQSPYWYVVFTYRGKVVADANVSPAGKLLGAWTGVEALVPYAHQGLSAVLTSWLVLLPASVLFLLPFLDPRRLRRLAHLDALAVLAFLLSWLFFADGKLEPAVWLAYPPLIYLLLRLLRIGFRGDRVAGALAPVLSLRTLMVGLPLMLAGRIALSLLGHQEVDVGYESVIGAFRILHHLPIYYNDPNHGDTYGPFMYLAYIPFELLFPWKNTLNDLHAADAAAIFFDLGTVLGLVLLGRRLRQGAEGTRLGLVLAWAWAACPFTVIGLVLHTNDGLISMLSVIALVVLASPIVSGAVLGLAAAAKFSPAGLLPLLAAPRERGLKGALACVGAFTVVVVAALFSWLPPGGLGYVWRRTIEFQISRPDVFSPWGLHPTLHPIQILLEVGAVLLAGAVAFLPRDRSLVRVCALAGAVTVAIQLPATHWYYYYIMWFLPFALVALLVRPTPPPEPVGEEADVREPLVHVNEPEPALAGA